MAYFIVMRYKEVKGHWPLMKPKKVAAASVSGGSRSGAEESVVSGDKTVMRNRATSVST